LRKGRLEEAAKIREKFFRGRATSLSGVNRLNPFNRRPAGHMHRRATSPLMFGKIIAQT
jgi:hypothetical protein